jgi:hypothetical protein
MNGVAFDFMGFPVGIVLDIRVGAPTKLRRARIFDRSPVHQVTLSSNPLAYCGVGVPGKARRDPVSRLAAATRSVELPRGRVGRRHKSAKPFSDSFCAYRAFASWRFGLDGDRGDHSVAAIFGEEFLNGQLNAALSTPLSGKFA